VGWGYIAFTSNFAEEREKTKITSKEKKKKRRIVI